ncbi:hypothetical protein DNL40_01190 [Xylanimonas oleitrophica]|uniref:DUF1697 domain-containing protein n=1 Tax=Xylanimonas oleitrophica TaxID=2607479 RepID=A0A2W5WV53_9MICO|nr:DUF1697 domain-containing protein [Xylanimonas oleitrophica]PZR55040.1 hypothetical protein DNL40_01190 [Xylanimonas oleitrophica]
MSDTFVVLLRAVNLGPHHRVPAADLRAAATAAGLADARTYAASGNLVATAGASGATSETAVADLVSRALEERLGEPFPAVALSLERLEAVVAANPFTAAARDHPAQLQVHVPFGTLDAAGVARLALANPGRELLTVASGVLYVHYVDGIGTSRITAKVLERAAGTVLTGRSWSTTTRLLTMARGGRGGAT